MAEDNRTLEEACYELDSSYSSQFSMLNDAIFTNKTGINLVTLNEVKDNRGKYTDWEVTIQQGQKIGEVMDRVPFGILNKTITGLGATTLEIMNQERNSIIVVPTKALAYSKYKSANLNKGDGYAFYVGSPIKEIRSNVSPSQIQTYLNNNTSLKKKFLVVADSLPSLLKVLEKNNISVYSEYFLMVDEIDTMQADSTYRPRLEDVMDYYFNFDRKHRSAVSATLNDFSNPMLMNESRVTTHWEKNPQRQIDLIYTNYVDDIAIKVIKKKLSQSPNEKILVAYNSLDGILNILTQLKKTGLVNADKSDCGILCSERNNDKVKEYIADMDNVIDEESNLQKKIVFMTCAYFAGIDIQDRCHLITITSHLQPFTYLSVSRMAQIAGRCRNGNLSETIIYDIPQTTAVSNFKDKYEYQNSLIDRAKTYATFLNSTKNAINENPELSELGSFINSFVDYSAKAKVADKDYPIKIVRQECIENGFVPSFFNIDALTEKWHLVHSLYTEIENLYKELVAQGNIVTKFGYCIDKDEHDTSSIVEIKERNKERRNETLETLKTQLLEWNRNGMDDAQYQSIKPHDKKLQELCEVFKKLSPYIDDEVLFDGLSDNYSDKRKLRNYVNAVVFHILPPENAFKADVLAKFHYAEILPNLGKRKIGIVGKQEKCNNLKEVFRVQFRKTDISDDTLADYFTCFFKTSRSGGVDKIQGLNPLDLPTPAHYIDGNMNLLDLFMFP